MEKDNTFGRYFEELEIGDIYRHWPGKTITESEAHLFSLLTMNHHPIHLDAHYAAGKQHGMVLVVGTYVLSLVVGMSVRDISGKAIANLAYDEILHEAPVFIGDTLYASTRVLDKKLSQSKPDRGAVFVETVAKNQNGVKVLSLKRKILIPLKNVSHE